MAEAGLGLYWRTGSGGEWNVFDHLTGTSLFRLPLSRGTAILMDDQKFVVCFTKFGFKVEVYDLRSGLRLQTWTPWWWVPPWLKLAMVSYVVWSWSWVTWAARRQYPAWIDVAFTAGILIAVFAFRFQVTGGPQRSFSYGYSIPEQAIRGVSCAVLVLATCGLFAGAWVFIRRLVTLVFLVAGLGALLGWLLVYTREVSSWEIQPQSAPVFEDAWTALVGILPVVGMALVACWLSLAVGLRLRNLGELTGTRLEYARPGQSHATKPVAWRLVVLFMLIAGCAVLLQVSGPYAATARDELLMLYDNEVFSQFLRPISMTAVLTTALAYCGLAGRLSTRRLSIAAVQIGKLDLSIAVSQYAAISDWPSTKVLRQIDGHSFNPCIAF